MHIVALYPVDYDQKPRPWYRFRNVGASVPLTTANQHRHVPTYLAVIGLVA
jgi:hypothetical protein